MSRLFGFVTCSGKKAQLMHHNKNLAVLKLILGEFKGSIAFLTGSGEIGQELRVLRVVPVSNLHIVITFFDRSRDEYLIFVQPTRKKHNLVVLRQIKILLFYRDLVDIVNNSSLINQRENRKKHMKLWTKKIRVLSFL